jgi:hypothetical protein
MSDDLVKRLRDPDFGTETTERNLMNSAADRIEELEGMLTNAVEAIFEATYLLAPDEEDIAKGTGLYRIVTTLADLSKERSDEKGQDDE